MSRDTHTVLCGKCRVQVEGPGNPKDHDVFTCPSCGRSDNFKNVMRSVAAFVQEVTSRHLQESLRKAARGNKFIKVTSKPSPKRIHPFIADLKLGGL